MNTSAAIEYHGKSKSEVKPVALLQRILNRAAIIGDTETIKYLKENGGGQMSEIRVNRALEFAIENRQEDAAVTLIEWGGSSLAEETDPESQNTFLHRAALKGMPKTCSALLLPVVHPKIDAKNRHKSTALHCAVASGSVDTVRVLLQAGASIKIKNDHKNTALTLAKLYNQEEVISCLQSNGEEEKPKSDPLAPPSSSRISLIE